MGNHMVREFQSIELGKGSSFEDEHTLSPTKKTESLIAPRSTIASKSMRVLIKRDQHRKTTIVFDLETMLPMFVTSFPKNKNKSQPEQVRQVESVTKDARGRVLFLTTSAGKERTIYKATQDMSDSPEWSSRHEEETDESSSEESEMPHCRHRHSSKLSGLDKDMPCAAKIVADNSGPVGSAFLNVVVWSGSGPEFMSVYKAIKVPGVKYGTLVVDMKNRVVAKSRLDEQRAQPVVELAKGVDILAALAVISALNGNF